MIIEKLEEELELCSFRCESTLGRISLLTGCALTLPSFFSSPTLPPSLQDISSSMTNSTATSKPPVTLRIVVPASQCGSLIGKGGCKIKGFCACSLKSTGAQVQVAGDMLPNSTERAITIAGTPQSIIECVKQICVVMLESPPKGVTIPYRPKPSGSPVIFAGGQLLGPAWHVLTHSPERFLSSLQAYSVQGQHAIAQPDLTKLHQLAMQQSPFPLAPSNSGFTDITRCWVSSLVMLCQACTAAVFSSCLFLGCSAFRFALEMAKTLGVFQYLKCWPKSLIFAPFAYLSRDGCLLIGCIIGRQGAKINEIRQMSGAQIKIANPVEGSSDRQVTITGSPASISLAEYLINAR
ncbi:PCBP2 protein, partial [Amia calva]|nr:PCBP2 protein [Amia calva]